MKNRRRRAIILVICAFLLLSPRVREQILRIVFYNQCDTPTPYKIGFLDSRFGLSRTDAISQIDDATQIWSKSYGKQLFTNKENARLTVNFVYDERSALNLQISESQNLLTQNDAALQKKINSYEADVAAFEKKLAAFNSQVEEVNRSGGASPEEYDRLVAQQRELQAEGDRLNARAKELSLAVRDYNSKVKSLNQNIGEFNQAITKKPEEGLYDPTDHVITVYFVANRKELTHTLAHEFGHALGMQHTQDSKSIMNPNTSTYISITQEDKDQLTAVCSPRLLPILIAQQFRDFIFKK